MFLNASSWPCADLAASQQRTLKALCYLRPPSIIFVQRRVTRPRWLATKAQRQRTTTAVPYASKITQYESAARKLARNPSPTLLYQAQTNITYVLGCYFVGGVLLGCAIINNVTKEMSLTADVPAWVPLGVAVGQFAMVGFGSWWCLKVRYLDFIGSK